MPKISVCSSAYNHEKYAAEAIRSVLSQTCQDFELVITDDASTDSTVERIKEIKDPRITLFRHESNRGNMVASENCYIHTSGEYIAWLNTDDVMEPNMLKVLSSYLDQHPDLLGVFGDATFVGEDSARLDHQLPFNGVGLNRYQHLNNLFKVNNYFCWPASMIRRSTFDRIGYFPRYLRQIHDMAYWIRLLFEGELSILPDRVVKVRLRANDANAGSYTPVNRRRLSFEVLQNLQLYVDHIGTMDLLREIFPEVEQHPWPFEDSLVHLHLAHVALAQTSAFHRLFGLQLLYRLMSDRSTADYLFSKCKFDYTDLFRLEAERPLFADYDELGKSEAQLHQEIELLTKMLDDSRAHCGQLEGAYQELLNSASWKMTSLFRQARSLLAK